MLGAQCCWETEAWTTLSTRTSWGQKLPVMLAAPGSRPRPPQGAWGGGGFHIWLGTVEAGRGFWTVLGLGLLAKGLAMSRAGLGLQEARYQVGTRAHLPSQAAPGQGPRVGCCVPSLSSAGRPRGGGSELAFSHGFLGA